MKRMIVDELEPVTLIGGGHLGERDLKEALALAPYLVAADGGATIAMAQGHLPKAVIGDFDSVAPETLARLPSENLFHFSEQDTTDFDKARRSIRAPVILAVGFLGARIDHQLAAFNTLVQPHETEVILLGETEVVVHLRKPLHLNLSDGDVVSLFPMTSVTARSTGLRWPIDGIGFAPGKRIGTSNRATGAISIVPDGPGLLGIFPRKHLAQLVGCFT